MQRILHLCGIFKIDIEKEILKKIEANKDRDWDWDKMSEEHSQITSTYATQNPKKPLKQAVFLTTHLQISNIII